MNRIFGNKKSYWHMLYIFLYFLLFIQLSHAYENRLYYDANNFEIKDTSPGIRLFKHKRNSNCLVMEINLVKGGEVKSTYKIHRKDNEGTHFYTRRIDKHLKWGKEICRSNKQLYAVVNFAFFDFNYKNNTNTNKISYPIKVGHDVLTWGYEMHRPKHKGPHEGKYRFIYVDNNQKKVNVVKYESDPKTTYKVIVQNDKLENPISSYIDLDMKSLLSHEELIGSINADVCMACSKSKPRTYVGISNNNYVMYILLHKEATRRQAIRILESFNIKKEKIIIGDSGGSVQWLFNDNSLSGYNNYSTRYIPHALAVYSGTENHESQRQFDGSINHKKYKTHPFDYQTGNYTAILKGPLNTDTDFDLYLLRKYSNNGKWRYVKKSCSYKSNEVIHYQYNHNQQQKAKFLWYVYSFKGSGKYTLTINHNKN